MTGQKKKVLALIDGSEYSLLILHYVKEFLAPATHEIILLRVLDESTGPTWEGVLLHHASAEAGHARETARQQVMAELTPHCQALEAAGFTASIEVRVGHPQHEIDRLIEEAPIDLIAMTTHGHSGLRHMLMGSIAQHLLRHSALPLLVYRPFGYQ